MCISVAGAIAHKGKKLSFIVYDVKHPKQSPRYLTEMKSYIEQKDAYFAAQNEQREVWQKYRRELAYFEEGIAWR